MTTDREKALEALIARIDETISYKNEELPMESFMNHVSDHARGITWEDLVTIRAALSPKEADQNNPVQGATPIGVNPAQADGPNRECKSPDGGHKEADQGKVLQIFQKLREDLKRVGGDTIALPMSAKDLDIVIAVLGGKKNIIERPRCLGKKFLPPPADERIEKENENG